MPVLHPLQSRTRSVWTPLSRLTTRLRLVAPSLFTIPVDDTPVNPNTDMSLPDPARLALFRAVPTLPRRPAARRILLLTRPDPSITRSPRLAATLRPAASLTTALPTLALSRVHRVRHPTRTLHQRSLITTATTRTVTLPRRTPRNNRRNRLLNRTDTIRTRATTSLLHSRRATTILLTITPAPNTPASTTRRILRHLPLLISRTATRALDQGCLRSTPTRATTLPHRRGVAPTSSPSRRGTRFPIAAVQAPAATRVRPAARSSRATGPRLLQGQ